MFRSLIILSFVSGIFCERLTLNEAKSLIVELWGDKVNLTSAEILMRAEARRLGVRDEEFYHTCVVDRFLLSKKEIEQVRNNVAEVRPFPANASAGEVQAEMRYTGRVANWVIDDREELLDKKRSALRNDAQDFIEVIGDRIKDVIVTFANRNELRASAVTDAWDEALRNITASYEQLHDSTKDALERAFCFRATLRILDGDDVYAPYVDIVKKGMRL